MGVSNAFAQDLSDTRSLSYTPPRPNAGAALGGTISSPALRGKTCRYLVASTMRIQPSLASGPWPERLKRRVVEGASSKVAMLSNQQMWRR